MTGGTRSSLSDPVSPGHVVVSFFGYSKARLNTLDLDTPLCFFDETCQFPNDLESMKAYLMRAEDTVLLAALAQASEVVPMMIEALFALEDQKRCQAILNAQDDRHFITPLMFAAHKRLPVVTALLRLVEHLSRETPEFIAEVFLMQSQKDWTPLMFLAAASVEEDVFSEQMAITQGLLAKLDKGKMLDVFRQQTVDQETWLTLLCQYKPPDFFVQSIHFLATQAFTGQVLAPLLMEALPNGENLWTFALGINDESIRTDATRAIFTLCSQELSEEQQHVLINSIAVSEANGLNALLEACDYFEGEAVQALLAEKLVSFQEAQNAPEVSVLHWALKHQQEDTAVRLLDLYQGKLSAYAHWPEVLRRKEVSRDGSVQSGDALWLAAQYCPKAVLPLFDFLLQQDARVLWESLTDSSFDKERVHRFMSFAATLSTEVFSVLLEKIAGLKIRGVEEPLFNFLDLNTGYRHPQGRLLGYENGSLNQVTLSFKHGSIANAKLLLEKMSPLPSSQRKALLYDASRNQLLFMKLVSFIPFDSLVWLLRNRAYYVDFVNKAEYLDNLKDALYAALRGTNRNSIQVTPLLDLMESLDSDALYHVAKSKLRLLVYDNDDSNNNIYEQFFSLFQRFPKEKMRSEFASLLREYFERNTKFYAMQVYVGFFQRLSTEDQRAILTKKLDKPYFDYPLGTSVLGIIRSKELCEDSRAPRAIIEGIALRCGIEETVPRDSKNCAVM